jgi:hypothetical protein
LVKKTKLLELGMHKTLCWILSTTDSKEKQNETLKDTFLGQLKMFDIDYVIMVNLIVHSIDDLAVKTHVLVHG